MNVTQDDGEHVAEKPKQKNWGNAGTKWIRPGEIKNFFAVHALKVALFLRVYFGEKEN